MANQIRHTYPLLVWITSIIVPPILFVTIGITLEGLGYQNIFKGISDGFTVFMAIFMGGIFSIPSLIMFWILIVGISRLNISSIAIKILLSFIVTAMIFGTFYYMGILDRKMTSPFFWLPALYSLVSIFSIIIFKLLED